MKGGLTIFIPLSFVHHVFLATLFYHTHFKAFAMVGTKSFLLSVVLAITLSSITAIAGPTGPVAGERCTLRDRPLPIVGTRCTYLVCKDGLWTERTCPLGMFFNPLIFACVPESSYKCRE
jgi:hypothetical protein